MKVCELTERGSGKSTWLLNEFISGEFKSGVLFSINKICRDDLLRKFIEIYPNAEINSAKRLIKFDDRELYFQVLHYEYRRFLGMNYDFIGYFK